MGCFIECSIKELKIDSANNKLLLKIKGMDGFLHRCGSKEFNAFFPKDLGACAAFGYTVEPSVKILDANTYVSVGLCESCVTMLSNNLSHKVKIEVEKIQYNDAMKCFDLESCTFAIING